MALLKRMLAQRFLRIFLLRVCFLMQRVVRRSGCLVRMCSRWQFIFSVCERYYVNNEPTVLESNPYFCNTTTYTVVVVFSFVVHCVASCCYVNVRDVMRCCLSVGCFFLVGNSWRASRSTSDGRLAWMFWWRCFRRRRRSRNETVARQDRIQKMHSW